MHTAKVLRLSTDLPVIIEIVDTREKIDAFLPELDGLVGEGLRERLRDRGRRSEYIGARPSARICSRRPRAAGVRGGVRRRFVVRSAGFEPAGGVRWANC